MSWADSTKSSTLFTMLNDTPQQKTPALERREMRKMGRIGKIGICLLIAGAMLPSASANAETEVFEINKEYLCLI